MGWQARAVKFISPTPQGPAVLHLRRRLGRWMIPTLPGHRCGRALRALEVLLSQVPPRIIAAVILCLCNRWITGRRFQQGGRCILGCSPGEDSIEHYAYCPYFHSLCFKHLCIGKPPYQQCLEDFLCFQPSHGYHPGACQRWIQKCGYTSGHLLIQLIQHAWVGQTWWSLPPRRPLSIRPPPSGKQQGPQGCHSSSFPLPCSAEDVGYQLVNLALVSSAPVSFLLLQHSQTLCDGDSSAPFARDSLLYWGPEKM